MMKRWLLAAVPLVIAVTIAACNDEDGGVAGVDTTRTYTQVERLGNPLVSEVTFPKRDHGFHNTTGPNTDVQNGFRTKVEVFVTGVAGRQASLATTLSSVLVPDMLIVQPGKPGTSAGWLTWALADGYGGRKLTDDVVDAGLAAIFGSLLNSSNVSAGLSTDNVSTNDKAFTTTFPYLATPH
jgi:hypothetical protein